MGTVIILYLQSLRNSVGNENYGLYVYFREVKTNVKFHLEDLKRKVLILDDSDFFL